MKVDTSTVIKDYSGEPIVKGFTPGEAPSPITIRKLIQFAMTSPLDGDDRVDYKKKWGWHVIAEKAEQPIADYSAKDISEIIDRSAKIYTALIFGRLKEAIDPEPAA